jgi:hypothetical protein
MSAGQESVRLDVLVDCEIVKRQKTLKEFFARGISLVEFVDDWLSADLIIVDEVKKAFEARDNLGKWYIYIPDSPGKMLYSFPANVWIIPDEQLFDFTNIRFLFALSRQKEYRISRAMEKIREITC